MLTDISACYGFGPAEILEMTVGLRRRYYESIPRVQADRNLHAAGVVLLPHAGDQARAILAGWQAQRQVQPTDDGPPRSDVRARVEWLRERWQSGTLAGDGAAIRRGVERTRELVGAFERTPGFRAGERDDRARSRMRVATDG